MVISVIDDGAGLNTAAILAKARERGLVPAGAELAESEIFALIFQPGFSTAEKVTDVSGRGVGMDVVKREVDSLRGSIGVHSESGRGSRVDLSLPLTLAIIEGLLVHVAEDSYVIPLSAVEQCLELTPDRFATTSGRNVIQVQGAPVRPGAAARDLPRARRAPAFGAGRRGQCRGRSRRHRGRSGRRESSDGDQVARQSVPPRRLHFRCNDHGGWQRGADSSIWPGSSVKPGTTRVPSSRAARVRGS